MHFRALALALLLAAPAPAAFLPAAQAQRKQPITLADNA